MIQLNDLGTSIITGRNIDSASAIVRSQYSVSWYDDAQEHGIRILFAHRQQEVDYYYGVGIDAKNQRDEDLQRVLDMVNEYGL